MDANDLVVEWAGKQDLWLSDALRRAIQHGTLSQAQQIEVLITALDQHGLLPDGETAPTPIPLSRDHLNIALQQEDCFVLKSLKKVQHVNALASNQELTFAPKGITVIYGANGSGKSGYSRILKDACRARHSEPILPNINTDPPGMPSAVFTVAPVDQPDDEKTVIWKPDAPSAEMATLAMFDRGCANVLLNEKNEPAYSTALIDAISSIGPLMESVRLQIQDRAAQSSTIPAEVEVLSRSDSPTGLLLRPRGMKALDLDALGKLNGMTEDEEQALSAAEWELADLKASDPEKRAREHDNKARAYADCLEQVDQIQATLSQKAMKELSAAITDSNTKSTVAKQVMDKVFTDAPLTGMGSDLWKALFLAARKYSIQIAYPEKPFPNLEADAVCPLCMQDLDDTAKERLNRFDQMASNAAQKAANDATAVVSKIAEQLAVLPERATFDHWLEELATTDEGLRDAVAAWLDQAARVKARAIKAATEKDGLDLIGIDAHTQRQVLQNLIGRHQNAAAEIRKLHDSEARQKKLMALETTIRHLRDRQTLATIWQIVEEYSSARERAGKFHDLAGSIKTNTLTTLSKKLLAELTGPIETQINQELDQMGYTGLRPEVVPTGGKANVKHVCDFTNAKQKPKAISDVLSEGEQRVLSLALFLAEVQLAPGNPGVIFDDPVCSLDFNWLDQIAQRLAKEAAERQVVVFTHNIAFMLMLDYYAKKNGVEVAPHSLHRLETGAGHVRPDAVWDAMGLNNRIKKLNTQIQDSRAFYKAAPGGEAYLRAANDIVDGLRSCWERLVEEVLLAGVVQRFRPGVATQMLRNVVVTDELFKAVYWAMTEISRQTKAHDHAPGGGSPVPTPDDLIEMVSKVKKDADDMSRTEGARRKALVEPTVG